MNYKKICEKFTWSILKIYVHVQINLLGLITWINTSWETFSSEPVFVWGYTKVHISFQLDIINSRECLFKNKDSHCQNKQPNWFWAKSVNRYRIKGQLTIICFVNGQKLIVHINRFEYWDHTLSRKYGIKLNIFGNIATIFLLF